MSAEPSPFISVQELAANQQAGRTVRLLDIRFDPGKGSARSRYLDGHIPGAVYVDLPTQLAAPKGATGGNLPLPALAAFEAAAQSWGLTNDDDVVVYDDSNGAPAARAAYVLRWAGHARVRLLDGGLGEWRRNGIPVSTIDEAAGIGAFLAASGGVKPLGAADVAAFDGQLIDARPHKAFAEGHIPGAINVPTGAVVDDQGRLLPADEIRQHLAERGIALDRSLVAYCGGGVASSFTVIALASLGKPVALYPGSWSDWISDPSRPIEK